MISINRVEIGGYLGKDPEVRKVGDSSVCSFSVASTERWKDSKTHEDKEKTEWSNVVIWGQQADACGKYLKKGSPVLVEGKKQTRSYETESGEKRYSTEIIANRVHFLSVDKADSDSGRTSEQPSDEYRQPPSYEMPQSERTNIEDDLPF